MSEDVIHRGGSVTGGAVSGETIEAAFAASIEAARRDGVPSPDLARVEAAMRAYPPGSEVYLDDAPHWVVGYGIGRVTGNAEVIASRVNPRENDPGDVMRAARTFVAFADNSGVIGRG